MHPPIFLPPSLYRAAKDAGYDLTGYAITRPIPITRHLQKPEQALSPLNSREVQMTTDTKPQSALGKAIALWSAGRNIPFTLAVELVEQGYDVGALRQAHFARP
jgi:hypothetical protein